MQYFEVISYVYSGLEDLETADSYYRYYKIWTDSVYTDEKTAKVLELDTKHKLEKKDLNIQLLNEKRVEIEAQFRQRNLSHILALLLLLVISAALYST